MSIKFKVQPHRAASMAVVLFSCYSVELAVQEKKNIFNSSIWLHLLTYTVFLTVTDNVTHSLN